MTRPEAQRLAPQPGEVIDRARPVRFSWDGGRYEGMHGDTIASALLASGVTVFSRSFKYSRPRGILTADFLDPGCRVQVDDEPNVRGAHRRVAEGMQVRPQNVWPSLRFDMKSANRGVGRFLTAGFYYKTFIKPQRIWPAYERVLSRFASGGVVSFDPRPGYFDKRYVHADVVVAGGGPAGIAAALAAADAGATVMLVEEEYDLGGHLRWGDEADRDVLAELRRRLARSTVEVLVDSAVTGRYDDNWIAIVQRSNPQAEERLLKVRAGVLVVACGLVERPYVFEGNDLPGVMLSTAVRRLVNLYAVRPGSRAVVITANPEGDAASRDLERVGVEVARTIDMRIGGSVVRARGRGRVRAVELTDGTVVDADLLVTATGWTAPTALLNMAGNRPVWDDTAARFVPGPELAPGVLATGGLVGDADTEGLIDHGREVGALAAARAAGRPEPAVRRMPPAAHPALFRSTTHGFIDWYEDVTSKDIEAAAKEGYDSIELVKRFTTATMGPSQGKLETINTVAALADATNREIGDVGTTVWRPPYAPISLGALAGRIFQPVRHSPMQSWHETHNAVPLVAGEWIRPDSYGDAVAEARVVRQAVGIIDVTPLGKFLLEGPDVPKLLNHVYVNSWSELPVGSVRYGAMCAEDGVVMDDGVTGRLSDTRYLMSTTSSGVGGVWEWLENCLQAQHPEWAVHVVPMTPAYASMNIAGPSARTLLERVVRELNLSNEAFPYMRVREGQVAGVDDCILWRIGFTGELSYEIHVPASYGLHVWSALLETGADLGVGVFGVEAQRILRLEKGHLIVGQDTDGLTTAAGAGLGRMVKLDKPDFIGRSELAQAEHPHVREAAMTLVALRPDDASCVPTEASQIIGTDGAIIGRITSSRMSATLGHSICLAQLARAAATPGATVTIRLPDGRNVTAAVCEQLAFFDPDGGRLRV
jgi:sarcosine oxidase, subunit alpha